MGARRPEPGWGINFAHQGASVFATWYTYDAGGVPLWLSVLAPQVGATNVYAGTLYRTSGPRFDAYDTTKADAGPGGSRNTDLRGRQRCDVCLLDQWRRRLCLR